MAKTLTLDIQITLPTGQVITIAKPTLELSGLEAYAVQLLLDASGGKLDVKADATVTES